MKSARNNKLTYRFLLLFTIVLSVFYSFKGVTKKKRITTKEVNKIRAKKLQKYAFQRNELNKEDMTLMLGNAEMGGRARLDGLGFDRIWFSDFWRSNAARMPIFGPKLSFKGVEKDYKNYSQKLEIKNGLLSTNVAHTNVSYKSELFFSAANRDILVIRLSDIKGSGKDNLTLQLPVNDVDGKEGGRWDVRESNKENVFTVAQKSDNLVLGTSIDSIMSNTKLMFASHGKPHKLNKMVYGLWSSASLKPSNKKGEFIVDTKNNDEVLLIFTESTNWSGGLLETNVLNSLKANHNFNHLLKANTNIWKNEWEKYGVLDIPDIKHDQLWYRSVFWLQCTSSSEKFLPGECQFGHEGWNMLPFTYGTAGWSVHDFTMLGSPEKAARMLNWHFKPASFNRNATYWLNYAQKERVATNKTQKPPYAQNPNSKDAWMFGHELRTSGDGTLTTWGNQAHLAGFGLELFRRYYNYYPSEDFLYGKLYPVAKGVAEFWSNFLIWDAQKKEYYTPKTWGSSEGGKQNNPLDAVMAAKKCLRAAATYAKQLNIDDKLVEKWNFIEKNIHYPENKETYLAYKGHDGNVPEKSIGYNGIRYMNAANFVNQELVQELDQKKVTTLLGKISASNRFGTGFAVFHSAQTATAECLFKRGDSALGYLNGMIRALDKSGTAMRECEDRHMPYFSTNTNAYILVPIFMLMQSTNNKIEAFPAVPSTWKDVAFYNLPAENGVKVSGKMKNGKIKWVSHTKNGKEIYRK
ncbi:hypothetical protein H9I45_04495 [Polaribacter haliotis]|uniref:Glycosyl hydrolase family 95 catalytic domain-containing protein n=1 Tax=Polaribacter haliotis TaxID=1888915 RepID=A0A7L8AI77_9FLAO|nr:hypothetical protein [Polaribacter haliotis]QOD61715.1 hypothetical protein H9I45_04495 [Polaribacter haliotis]